MGYTGVQHPAEILVTGQLPHPLAGGGGALLHLRGQGLEEENLPYLQLHDPEGITGKLYNYNGIPFIILISPEGIILEKELWGDGIREAITKYIK